MGEPSQITRVCFETIAHDLRLLLRLAAGRNGQPSAVILDGRTVHRAPESGADTGYDGHKRRKGREGHLAVDTLGYLMATAITPANAQERTQVAEMATLGQQVTGQAVELAYVDQGYTGDEPAEAAAAQGVQLDVIKLPEAARLTPSATAMSLCHQPCVCDSQARCRRHSQASSLARRVVGVFDVLMPLPLARFMRLCRRQQVLSYPW
jgi:hypothetical protein